MSEFDLCGIPFVVGYCCCKHFLAFGWCMHPHSELDPSVRLKVTDALHKKLLETIPLKENNNG